MSSGYAFSITGLLRGLIGIAGLIAIAYLLSTNRKAVSWKVVFGGLLMQALLGIGVIFVPAVYTVFEFVGRIFIGILDFTKEGSRFVFGDLVDSSKSGYIFAFQILPTIIFFSALTSVLYYYGIIQFIVKVFAWVLVKLFKLSGAESLVTSANIFIGQIEAPLLVRSYLSGMTASEIFLVMTAGMSTLAGGVLAAYIGFLGGNDPVQKLLFAKHLIAASVMAAPGAVAISKIIVPQTLPVSAESKIDTSEKSSNVLDALTKGTSDGLKVAASIAAILLVFVAFIAFFNVVAAKLGSVTGINEAISMSTHGHYTVLSLQYLLGYIFAPVMWMIGVCSQDLLHTGRLLGEKLILTEFIGYNSLTNLKNAGVFYEQKSVIMAAYFLSGFANFASVGIQITGIGLLAPNKKQQLSQFGFRAMIAGALASLLSASLIGILQG